MNVPLVGRDEIAMTREQAHLLASPIFEDTLRTLGLSVFCKRCYARGLKDGVSARNGMGDAEWTVECSCSVRRFRRHADPES